MIDPLNDQTSTPYPHNFGPWRTLQVPLPPRLWLAPEPAEQVAGALLTAISGHVAAALAKHGEQVEALQDLVSQGRLALRTYAVISEAFRSQPSPVGPSASPAPRLDLLGQQHRRAAA